MQSANSHTEARPNQSWKTGTQSTFTAWVSGSQVFLLQRLYVSRKLSELQARINLRHFDIKSRHTNHHLISQEKCLFLMYKRLEIQKSRHSWDNCKVFLPFPNCGSKIKSLMSFLAHNQVKIEW